jgi:hypothetical protein
MRVHIDVVGWLTILWGVLGVLTGLSLVILAGGTVAADAELQTGRLVGPAAWLLLLGGAALMAGGLAMWLTGRALVRRVSRGRLAALLLALPNLLIVPFGTALGIYTIWALLNDDARRLFGRPPRSAPG